MTTFNTSPHLPNSVKDEVTIQLQIPLQHVGETLNWLVEQSIPFRVHFSKTHLSELPILDTKAQIPPSPAGKITIRDSETNIYQETLGHRISHLFDNYITNGLTKLPPTQEEIAAELSISMSDLKSHLKSFYGKTFYQVYIQKRMEYAAQLLQKGYRANKVSAMVGYGEKSCIKFNKMFQKHFGETPKRYQISHK